MHDSYGELNSAYASCSFSPREVHPEAVSEHFYIDLGLGIHGGGACLHSLHEQGVPEFRSEARLQSELHVVSKWLPTRLDAQELALRSGPGTYARG